MSDPRPTLDPRKVESFVGSAHGDLDAVRELLAKEPALVNAAWSSAPDPARTRESKPTRATPTASAAIPRRTDTEP